MKNETKFEKGNHPIKECFFKFQKKMPYELTPEERKELRDRQREYNNSKNLIIRSWDQPLIVYEEWGGCLQGIIDGKRKNIADHLNEQRDLT